MNKHFYNLTNPQNSIWLTNQMYSNTAIGNICGTVFIDEKVDFSILEKSINTFVQKNDSFRLKLEHTDNGIHQYVSDFVPFKLEIKKIRSKEDVSDLEKELVSSPFPLSSSLLFKFVSFEFSDGTGGFIMNAHHLIVDAWTVGITLNGIIEHYEYFTKSRENIPDTYPTYIDYIDSEKEYIKSDKYIKDKEYWENLFKQVPEVARIPGSKQSLKDSVSANRIEFNISKDIVNKINEYCKANRASIFTFFMAVYGIYISRVSGLETFTVGTPILNRTNFTEKNTTGMFVSTIPFSYSLKPDLSFSEYLLSISTTSMGMLRHQKYPYSHLLTDLRKEDSSIPNLYDVLISYQNIRSNRQTANVKYHTKWNFNNCLADSLNIHIYDTDDTGSLDIAYDYREDIYSKDDMLMLHQRILHLINQVMKNPDEILSKFEIITPKEKQEILYDFNMTDAQYDKTKTITELIEQQVEKTPNNIAVVFEDSKLTYKELNEKANSLAYYLRNNGINRNSLVGIMVNRSLEMIISILAVLKAGGAYIPIDPTYPKDRIKYMLENSNSKLLLTQEHLSGNIEFNNKICVDLSNESIYSLCKDNLTKVNKPEDLSYVIYTSGSTGLPKGVALKHIALSNLTAYCNNYVEYLAKPSYSSVVSITTISFDIFIFETLISLQKGLKLIIANENEQTIPKLLNDLIIKHDVKIMQATPSRMQILLNNLNDFGAIKNLKYITLAGEQLPLSLVNTLHKLCGAVVYNGYGPSETTVFSTLTKMNDKEITIGKPLFNTQIYILDKYLNPVPVGTQGEIYISGDGVGKGYLNNSDLTNKSFITNPFIPGTIMYKTGDLGTYTPNGDILCLGRIDNQVKIRGLRIELGEIEEKLSQISSIESCVVIKKADKTSHEFLCAYYTSSTNIDLKSIREHLKISLPNYMIPQYFIKMDVLPYTPNGKIDRKKLPEPEIIEEKKDIVLPRNEIDSKLIDMFKNVLDIDTVSIDDSFYDLGGDSLSAINLCAQIQNEFNVQIYVKDILENPELKNLSEIVSKKSDSSTNVVVPPIPKADKYPVSSAQKRVFFASQIGGNSNTSYNLPGGIIFDGKLDIEKLEKCLQTLINRHESLRTYFEVRDGNVIQKIIDTVNFKLNVLVGQDINNIQTIFMKFVKPFDLAKAPLFRAQLVCFSHDKYALFIDMHHIISDGTSLSILTDELCKLYNNEVLPELKITYKDYSAFENERLTSSALKEAEAFWLHQFEGEIPVLNLPTIGPRPAVQSFEGKKVYTSVSAEIICKIENTAKAIGVTPYMLMLGAYYVLLSKYTSQDELVVGSPVVGRDILDTYNIIGMFVNTLPLKETIDNDKSFKEFVFKLKDNLLNCYKYQTYPFDELVNKLNIRRDTSRNPLFDTMFIYQNNGYKDVQFSHIKSEYYIPDTNVSKFDLSVEVIPNKNGANLSFEYATKLFAEEFIKNMAFHYLNILNNILDNIDAKISEIQMLSEEEKDKILYGFNNAKLDYDENITISQLFEEQVEKTPDNIAIVFEDKELTYKELNEKANSLAHYLRNNNIGRNSLVGIMVNRSIEMIIAILAVLKAGGAYIPIDPTYPKDRIKYMLENSNSKLLLTQKHLVDNIDFSHKVCVDLSNEEVYSLGKDNLNNINKPEDLSYVIYTSGSTGLPKGALLNHKALSNLTAYCNNYVEYLKNSSNISIVSITTISFDIFIFETLISLQKGLKLVIANENEQTTPKLLSNLIIKHHVQAIQATPSRMQMLLDNIGNFTAITNLKYITLAGEQLPLSLVNKLHELCGAIVYNGYGPSETTVFSTLTKMNDDIITIGKPLPNTEIYILDKYLKPVPIGIAGEIYISGDGVGKGYLNNDELTNNSFITNPFISNSIMYKSGDIGMYTSNGEILCLGRLDGQIKIRGLRIELGEIEALISKYPDIKKVVVIKQVINKRECLSAYYVSSKNIDNNELRKYLEKSLPKYMVPSYFVALDDLPYTPNGKINKKALPIPSDILSLNETEYVSPKTALQKEIVEAFESVLNTKPIGINDNFFELGGDSLLAMSLIVELQKISTNITYSDLFQYSTVSEIEEKINSKSSNELLQKKIDDLSDSYLDILNNCTKKDKKKKYSPKNVIITGCTGFLGIHILREFIENEDGNIYCIVREKPGLTARARLHQKLNYYFGNKYDDLLDKRIFAITGDITEPGFGLTQDKLLTLANSTDILINSAARVAHFGHYNDFYNSNVTSVKYMIDFCKTFNKKFYHISTISVGGLKMDLSLPANKKKQKIEFDESSFYIGQSLDNVYARTKFKAEQYILEAMSGGLDAYIFRMGHLMPRFSDGVFQENISNNAVTNRMVSLVKIGIVPQNLLENILEFTPVDYAARAIFKLIENPSNKNRIFILINPHTFPVHRLVNISKKQNIPLTIVSKSEFSSRVKEILDNTGTKHLLNFLMTDFDKSFNLNYNTGIKINSNFTAKYLKKLHFKWPKISRRYLINFINLLWGVIKNDKNE